MRCSPIVLRLAAALPTVDFLIAGDEGTGLSATPNVKFLGRLRDLGEVYSRTSIYLRLVKHDSLSAMVLEAMARGRHVIYSQPFPHAELALDFDQARAALTRLLERSTANETGAAYIRANFNLDIEAQTLRSCYRQWFGPGACRAVAQDHEVRG